MKIIFVIRRKEDITRCFQEIYAEDYWKQIGDFEKYCEEFSFSYTKKQMGLLGIHEDWEYIRHEYCPDPGRRLENKMGWKEMFT